MVQVDQCVLSVLQSMITWIETTIASRRKNEKAAVTTCQWVAPAQVATDSKAGKRKRAAAADVTGSD